MTLQKVIGSPRLRTQLWSMNYWSFVLLEAVVAGMGTEAHLEIQVGALFSEGFAWAEEVD